MYARARTCTTVHLWRLQDNFAQIVTNNLMKAINRENTDGQARSMYRKGEIRWALLPLLEKHRLGNNGKPQHVYYARPEEVLAPLQ